MPSAEQTEILRHSAALYLLLFELCHSAPARSCPIFQRRFLWQDTQDAHSVSEVSLWDGLFNFQGSGERFCIVLSSLESEKGHFARCFQKTFWTFCEPSDWGGEFLCPLTPRIGKGLFRKVFWKKFKKFLSRPIQRVFWLDGSSFNYVSVSSCTMPGNAFSVSCKLLRYKFR